MKKAKVIFWIATSFIFLFEGLMPLSTLVFAPEYFNAGTKPLGYPDYFAFTLIIFKILGSTVLMLPQLPGRIREWAYAGLTFNLVFAVISHMVVDKNISYILMPVVVGMVLAVSYFYDNNILGSMRSSAQAELTGGIDSENIKVSESGL